MKPNDESISTETDEVPDAFAPEQRQFGMSRIKGKDAIPDVFLRRVLHARGFCYRLHGAYLSNKPDMVSPRHQPVVFVHGRLWHARGCSFFRRPKIRAKFWRTILNRKIERDRDVLAPQRSDSWGVLVIWERTLRGWRAGAVQDALNRVDTFIRHGRKSAAEIAQYKNSDTRTLQMHQPNRNFIAA